MTNCGKMCFISRLEAKTFIRDAEKRNGLKGGLKIYNCNRCDFWHTTRQNKKQRRTILKRMKRAEL